VARLFRCRDELLDAIVVEGLRVDPDLQPGTCDWQEYCNAWPTTFAVPL